MTWISWAGKLLKVDRGFVIPAQIFNLIDMVVGSTVGKQLWLFLNYLTKGMK